MQYNLYSPAIGVLTYPHYTKSDKGVVFVVTHPDKLIKVNDVIYSEGSGFSNMGRREVLEVLEQREAKGEHSVDFVPVFQKLKTQKI